MGKIRYGVIGSGWRAEFYIRIAKAVPDKFEFTAVLIRDKEKGRAFSEKFGVAVVNSLDELMKENPEFVVLAIKRGYVTDYLLQLFEKTYRFLRKLHLEKVRKIFRNYGRPTKISAKDSGG